MLVKTTRCEAILNATRNIIKYIKNNLERLLFGINTSKGHENNAVTTRFVDINFCLR